MLVNLCYQKTQKGIDEVERRAFGLPLRQRRVLILVDGKRDTVALSSNLPQEDVAAMLATLEEDGFIAPVESATPSTISPANTSPLAKDERDDGQRIEMARNFMANTTRAYIGFNGSSLINKIDACTDLESLRAQYESWRNAIQLSRDGKKHVGELERKLAALLF